MTGIRYIIAHWPFKRGKCVQPYHLDHVMDTDNKASASVATACATDEALKVTLPPKDATCDLTSEKMTKKAKRKASRSRQKDDTRHCVTDCLVNREGTGNMGATFSDIGELIDGVVDKELKDIVIVGGSREAMEKVPTAKITEELSQLLVKAKTVTCPVTVSSVLPILKRHDPEHLADVPTAS